MRFTRKARAEVEVNLTPLIDVVFLLLIFFMVSTTFIKDTELAIDLPEATAEPANVKDNQIEIAINRTGEYAINETSLVRHDLETLKMAIQKTSGGDSAVPLVITADAATPHQAVVTAMDAAGQLGFVSLSITTRSPQENSSDE